MSSDLKRSLTLYGLTMVAVGSSIGSGIFRTPGSIAGHVHLPEYVIALWVIGGIVALTGALTYAEMGSMFPGAGGLYTYLREAYGDAVAFTYGWFILFVSTSGAIAALCAVSAEHLLYLYDPGAIKTMTLPLAVFILIFLSVVNLFGVKIGEWIANIFTGAKLLGLFIIIGAGLFFARPGVAEANMVDPVFSTPPTHFWSAFALGLTGILWSYGGWHHASFMAGETINPQRNIPRAMIIGSIIITTVYVLANVAYMRLLPLSTMASSRTLAADALQQLIPWGGTLMAFLIALSTFGSTGIYCMTAPRIYYSMAKDGIFFKGLAKTHPKWKTPVNAILLQSGWSLVLLLFWGTFEYLMEYVTFIDFLGQLVVATTIFVFRKRMPDAPRGYKTPFYPVVPLIFIGICAWFVLFTLIENPVRAIAGIVVVLVGLLVYFVWFKKKQVSA